MAVVTERSEVIPLAFITPKPQITAPWPTSAGHLPALLLSLLLQLCQSEFPWQKMPALADPPHCLTEAQ